MGTFVKKLENFEKNLYIKKEGPTITVSGTSGSGKTTASVELAHVLGLRHVSVGDIFRKIAEEKKMKFEDYTTTRNKDTDLMADEETIKIAKKGNVVLNGRLVGWVAGSNADIRVFIFCEPEEVARRVSVREKKNIEEARKDVERRDKGDWKIYKDLYDIDMKDNSIYDIIIDNTKLTIDGLKKEVLQQVKNRLKSKGF